MMTGRLVVLLCWFVKRINPFSIYSDSFCFVIGSHPFLYNLNKLFFPFAVINIYQSSKMVWALLPVDSPPGAQTYYIFDKGTYKVGRKDCDMIIQTDRGVSRLHAEIIVDAMCPTLSHDGSTCTNVHVRDHSKFGTFVNKKDASKAVHSRPNKVETLKDGDVISFGTGNASFRFCFYDLVIFVGSSKNALANCSVKSIISSIGARATNKWSPECTHALTEESSPLTNDLLDAIISHKAVVVSNWFKILAEKGIRTEIPDCYSYFPTVTVNGHLVKIVRPKFHEKCLEGHTFVLKSTHLYKFGNKLASLIEAFGGNVISLDVFSSNSQMLMGGGKYQVVLVNPAGSISQFVGFAKPNDFTRIDEVEFICAVLGGHFEIIKTDPSPILVTSSHSTDETVIPDSDVEVDTAASNHIPPSAKFVNAGKYDNNDIVKFDNNDTVKYEHHDVDAFAEEAKLFSKAHGSDFIQSKHEADAMADASTYKSQFLNSRVKDSDLKEGDNDLGTSADKAADIIYDHDLIVKKTPVNLSPVLKKREINFKNFCKTQFLPGNTYQALIQFSEDPYHESDYQNNDECTAYVKEEKKRKEKEAIAEDLFKFNNAKVAKKKRGATDGSIHAFLSRR